MTTTRCPVGVCDRNVYPDMIMCRMHWHRVPLKQRAAVNLSSWSSDRCEANRMAIKSATEARR